MNGQMDIQNFLELYKRSLSVLYNGKPSSMSYKEIFDSTAYDTLKCITYVASPRFLYENAKDFSFVEIIIGIPDGTLQRSVKQVTKEYLFGQKGFFNSLPEDAKSRVCQNTFNLLFAKMDGTKLPIFHSKIYIMTNSDTGAGRVVVGSVNFTNAAFSDDNMQFEEALVFDKKDIVEYYSNRYDYIRTISSADFIPEKDKKAYLSGDINAIVIEKADIIEKLTDKGFRTIISGETLENVLEADSQETADIEDSEKTIHIIEAASVKRNGILKMKAPSEIMKSQKLEQVIINKPKKSKLDRYVLSYDDSDGSVRSAYSSQEGDVLTKIEYPETEEIKYGLNNLDDFVLAYRDRIVNPGVGETNAKGVFESLLYAMESPFLWKARQELEEGIGTMEDIPLFCVIQGEAESGKSKLLKYISKFMTGSEEYAIEWKDVFDGSSSLLNLMTIENNAFPLIVDEVKSHVFTGRAQTDNLKTFANTREGQGPALICASNIPANLKSEMSRRVYTIRMPGTFKGSEYGAENDQYRLKIMECCNNSLFHAVCIKLAEKCQSGLLITDGVINSNDFLAPVREILKGLYQECGMPVPDFFPDKPFSYYIDLYRRKQWKETYLWLKGSGHAKYNHKENRIAFDLNIAGWSAVKKHDLINAVDMAMLSHEITNLDYVEFRAIDFYKWIGEKTPNLVERFQMKW